MPCIHVCSLALIGETVDQTGARSLVTLLNPGTRVVRPKQIAPERHLYIGVADIVEDAPGHTLPADSHVRELLEFVGGWDRAAPLLIHCFAGVSRSTAAAFISACALAPRREEGEIAVALRAASPTASPNPRLVAVADKMLGREGRMIDAIERIGRGEDCYEGVPFALEL
ncbi:MAG TPA: tyrosine phosphatase family protein, partial [Roseiarcus sp.]|nr:tyrosine phosphatase family protein [Roseiarcus sp.]